MHFFTLVYTAAVSTINEYDVNDGDDDGDDDDNEGDDDVNANDNDGGDDDDVIKMMVVEITVW